MGEVIISDASGNGILVLQGVVAGVAYSIRLNESHSISVEFQTSYFDLRFNSKKANFENELSPLGFDLQTTDSFFLNTSHRDVFDIHVGVQYIGFGTRKVSSPQYQSVECLSFRYYLMQNVT